MNQISSPDLCRVRTITAFIALEKDQSQWAEKIKSISLSLGKLMSQIEAKGYQVQTLRIVTNPFGEYLDTTSKESVLKDMGTLKDILAHPDMPKVRIRFAIGEAKTAEELALASDMINDYGDLSNICFNVEADEIGVPNYEKTLLAAKTIKSIAENTPGGLGNFNFTVNYNCPEYIPYFPASFHSGEGKDSIVLGFESPDLLLAALDSVPNDLPRNQFLSAAYYAMSKALQHHVDQVVTIAKKFAKEQNLPFIGIDSSAAPSKDCGSLVDVFKALGVEYFGAAGSVEISALLTRVFKSIDNVDLLGFSGLMLAATEDAGLARDAIAGKYDIRTFLTNSAVCGIGLDTIPIEGDTSVEKMAAIMQDTGTLAYRLKKPLTVRIFPVPGKSEGEVTEFESDDLCNCAVFRIP